MVLLFVPIALVSPRLSPTLVPAQLHAADRLTLAKLFPTGPLAGAANPVTQRGAVLWLILEAADRRAAVLAAGCCAGRLGRWLSCRGRSPSASPPVPA